MAKIDMPTSSLNQTPGQQPKKKLEKVTTGKVTVRQQTDIQKVASAFLAEDLATVKERIINDYAIPMLKNGIRPIFNDADLFTIKVQVATTGLSKVEDKYKAFIKQVIRSRKEYRGSGTPTMFTTEDALTEMLLLEDGMGRTLYADEAALARKLRVSKIVTVPEMDGRKGAKGGDLAAVIVNLSDYTVGADKGGAVSMFDDFDIDYNAMKYLIETRCSGALTTPYSAMAIEWAAA